MRAQQAIEFLSIIAIAILIVTSVLFVLVDKTSLFQRQADSEFMETVANNIDQDVRNIVRSPTDIKRNITIPSIDGEISIIDGKTLFMNESRINHIHFFDYYVNGKPCVGRNTLFRRSGILSICCNCNAPQVTFGNELMCLEDPYDWRPCNTVGNLTINKVAVNCTAATTYANFTIYNDTGVIFERANDLNVSHWFIDSPGVFVPEKWNLTVRCYSGAILDKTVNKTGETTIATCNDGIDNDGDSFIDFPDDPGCESQGDTTETNLMMFVSTSGDDMGSGNFSDPFLTFDKAQENLRANLTSGMTSDAGIFFRGGDYFLSDSIILRGEDSGRNGHQVIIAGYPGEEARLIVGQPIDPMSWVSLPSFSFTSLLASRPAVIYEDGVASHPAYHPNDGFFTTVGVSLPHRITFDPADITIPFNETNVSVDIWDDSDATMARVPIDSIDWGGNTIELAYAPWVFSASDSYRYRIVGAIPYLDAPGEFYANESLDLYYVPRHTPIDETNITIPYNNQSVIRIDGFPAAHIIIRNLTVGYTDDIMNSTVNREGAINVRDAYTITIENIKLLASGSHGVVIENTASGITVRNILINSTSGSGLVVSGDNNDIFEMMIARTGLTDLDAPGVSVSGDRDDLYSLTVCNSSGAGVSVTGGNVSVRYSKISHSPRHLAGAPLVSVVGGSDLYFDSNYLHSVTPPLLFHTYPGVEFIGSNRPYFVRNIISMLKHSGQDGLIGPAISFDGTFFYFDHNIIEFNETDFGAVQFPGTTILDILPSRNIFVSRFDVPGGFVIYDFPDLTPADVATRIGSVSSNYYTQFGALAFTMNAGLDSYDFSSWQTTFGQDGDSFDTDPEFGDLENGNYSIKDTSPMRVYVAPMSTDDRGVGTGYTFGDACP